MAENAVFYLAKNAVFLLTVHTNTYTGDFAVSISKSYLIKNGVKADPLRSFCLNYNMRTFNGYRVEAFRETEKNSNLCGKLGSVVRVKYCTPPISIKRRRSNA